MPSVHRVRFLGIVNCFFVEEDDGLTLVDTLAPRGERRIMKAAARLGRPVVRIVLTHAHIDHVGSLDQVAQRLPEAEVSISARDARFLVGDHTLDPGEPQDKLRGGYPERETKPDRLLEAGERVGSLEVLPAPGHTPGQVALLDVRDRTLYCADTYSTLGGVATTAKLNPRFPLSGMSTWHRPTALETARKLRALEPARLAPGHGKVVENPVAAMDAAIAKAS
jgi:glyoxylase-like metal-dependent hydrolase (beta-lactamase superfamily II)